MDQQLIHTLGDELFEAMTARTVVEPLTNRHPAITIENAYHVQQRMLQRRLMQPNTPVGNLLLNGTLVIRDSVRRIRTSQNQALVQKDSLYD